MIFIYIPGWVPLMGYPAFLLPFRPSLEGAEVQKNVVYCPILVRKSVVKVVNDVQKSVVMC